MIAGMVILNVVFAIFVVGGMLALHGWAIATDPGRRAREPRPARVPRTSRARGGRPAPAAR